MLKKQCNFRVKMQSRWKRQLRVKRSKKVRSGYPYTPFLCSIFAIITSFPSTV